MYRAIILLFFMKVMEPSCFYPTSHVSHGQSPGRNAWTSIQGTVYDDSTETPLEDVLLSLQPPPAGFDACGSRSNGDGRYDFSDLGNGLYKIITDKGGYLTETVTVRTYADSIITKDIYLTPSGG